MTGKQHIAIGVMASVLATSYATFGGEVSMQDLAVMNGGIILGSIIPDIDHPDSMVGRKFKLTSKLINRFFGGHRGMTHDVLWVVISAVLSCFFWAPWCGLLVGISLHIIADAFCVGGVPILWIFNRKPRYRILPKCYCCRCGSFYSYFLTTLMCAGLFKMASMLWR